MGGVKKKKYPVTNAIARLSIRPQAGPFLNSEFIPGSGPTKPLFHMHSDTDHLAFPLDPSHLPAEDHAGTLGQSRDGPLGRGWRDWSLPQG